MNDNIKKQIDFIFDESGDIISSRTKESYISKYHNSLYEKILKYNKDIDIEWNEKLHRYCFNIENNICELDNCNNKTKYRGFKRGYNTFCSTKCSTNSDSHKIQRIVNLKKNLKEKYGNDIENVFQLESVKEKSKKTCLEKYKVENINHNKSIREKIENTCLKKYNSKTHIQSDNFKRKTKETCLEKYGTEHHSKNDLIKSKTKKTRIEKYGGLGFDSDMINEKIKNTCLEKYKVENVFQNDFIKEKIKNTCFEKYGKEYYTQTDEYKEKSKQTCLKKYKAENYYYSDLYKEKSLIVMKRRFDKDNYNLISSIENNFYEIESRKCGHIFTIHYYNYYYRNKNTENVCTICNPIGKSKYSTSTLEKEISKYINSLNIEYIENNRTILDGKELDIYIPSKNLAIEFNGLYWHSELYKPNNYHKEKTEMCERKGINLLHIFEDDWIFKQDIVKNIINNKLGIIENKIFARKCIIKEVDSKTTRFFLDNNHIQGFSKSSYKLGLYYNNELVSLMTFGYRRTNSKKEFELIRFCNKINTNIIGAASKLFKYFIKNYYIEENYLISYADISMFNGNLYNQLGFEKKHRTKPNYFWIVDGIREHRFKYNKQNLIKEGADPLMTEREIMYEKGYYRIFGSGQDRYEYYIKLK